jgi:hypothetical protein
MSIVREPALAQGDQTIEQALFRQVDGGIKVPMLFLDIDVAVSGEL